MSMQRPSSQGEAQAIPGRGLLRRGQVSLYVTESVLEAWAQPKQNVRLLTISSCELAAGAAADRLSPCPGASASSSSLGGPADGRRRR